MDQSEILRAMRGPAFYPDHPSRVEIKETHISTLFLTDNYVYKVKKPVNFGFLDFTTLSARKFFCEQEVFLNSRLSPNVYLDVVAIRADDKNFTLGKAGRLVEYAVKMRRLPEQRMMGYLLEQGEIDEKTIKRIAIHLIGFHTRARTDPEISLYGTASRISKNTEENFAQTKPFVGKTISAQQYDRIAAFTRTFLVEHKHLFQKRIQDKKIRDCHGDVRIEHICIEDQISIFDCIEFNRRFRYSDVAADLAFLAMDLDFHKEAVLSRHLVRTYIEYTHDLDLLKLIRFYKCYRAYVRGKVGSFQGSEETLTPAEREKALRYAKAYFALADSYAAKRPCVIITSGLTGTGKSGLAEGLARDLDMVLFQSDRIRKEISGVPPKEHRFETFETGIYSRETSRATYRTLLSKAEATLKQGRSVILDATYLKQGQRDAVQALADKAGVPFFVIEATCPAEEVKRRLSDRLREAGGVSDGRWEIYLAQKKIHEPVAGVPADRHFAIDTSGKEDHLFEIEKQILIAVEG